MSSLTISHLKANLSAALDEVKSGHEILVTDRNTPIAKITRYSEGALAGQAYLLACERAGTLRRARKETDTALSEIIDNAPVEIGSGSALEYLLTEREEAR